MFKHIYMQSYNCFMSTCTRTWKTLLIATIIDRTNMLLLDKLCILHSFHGDAVSGKCIILRLRSCERAGVSKVK